MAAIASTKTRKTKPAAFAAKTVIGLDIGSHLVKVAVCRRQSKGWDVLAVDILPLAPGDTADPAALGARVLPWLKQVSGEMSSSYVASLPSNFFEYEAIDLAEAANYEATATVAMQEFLGDDLNEAAYDFWTTQEDSVTKIHLVWTMGGFASSLTNQFAKQGLQCRGLDAPIVALARVNSSSSTSKSRLLVDIGAGEVSFALSEDNQARYYRSRIRFAEQSAAENFAQRQNISRDAATTLLAQHGIANIQTNPFAALIHRTLDDWVHDLEFEIKRTSQFIISRWGGHSIEDIVLCGGGACIRGLDAQLNNHLGLPIQFASLPTGWRWKAGQAYSPLFAQALALTEYGEDA